MNAAISQLWKEHDEVMAKIKQARRNPSAIDALLIHSLHVDACKVCNNLVTAYKENQETKEP